MMMKRSFCAALLAAVLYAPAVYAHGVPTAQHGGVVAVAADITFELVARGEAAQLFVSDHGKPVDARGFSGQLTVLHGTARTQAALSPTGPNVLQAPLRLGSGARAVALVQRPGQNALTLRFVLP